MLNVLNSIDIINRSYITSTSELQVQSNVHTPTFLKLATQSGLDIKQ
jgi:hypothetical protein